MEDFELRINMIGLNLSGKIEKQEKSFQGKSVHLVAYQAPPSMEFPRQEYWSGLPLPSPGDPADLGIEPGS